MKSIAHDSRLPLAALGLLTLALTSTAHADLRQETDDGYLSLGGDVELNINAQNNQTASGPLFSGDAAKNHDEYDQDGRIRLTFKGEKRHADYYAKFLAQPTVKTAGKMGVDDAWLALGNDAGTQMKIGRFNAFNLFPKGQDVFVNYSGDTSDSLYRDGRGYIYQAKEARGRAGDAGQVMFSQKSGDFYAEISTLFGDRRDLFGSKTYHGYKIDPKGDAKDFFMVRPVVAWTPGPWTLAAGLETNLVSDALVDANGTDISDRHGYATRLSYDDGEWTLNANLAYMDAPDEKDFTLGLNALWNDFGLGYIHARNDIDNVSENADSDKLISMAGHYKIDTVYTSYRFSDVMSLKGMEIYPGAYYSHLRHDGSDKAVDRYGVRVRFKYHF